MQYVKNWFSNFEPLDKPIIYQGIKFYTVENFFQAMKVPKQDFLTRCIIANVSPSLSKKIGRKVTLRDDWEEIKFDVMEYGLRVKFAPGTIWHQKLMATQGEIVEWNNWGDVVWGKTLDGRGENHLGKLLMKIRAEYGEQSPENSGFAVEI